MGRAYQPRRLEPPAEVDVGVGQPVRHVLLGCGAELDVREGGMQKMLVLGGQPPEGVRGLQADEHHRPVHRALLSAVSEGTRAHGVMRPMTEAMLAS